MSELPGVYTTRLKDGTASYRAGITVKSKHREYPRGDWRPRNRLSYHQPHGT